MVEQTIPHTFIKRDLFGCIDIIAITQEGILGIQATGGVGHHAHRRAKIAAEPRMRLWLDAGGRLALWSWNKQGARGKQKRWTLREDQLTAALLTEWQKTTSSNARTNDE